MAAAAACVATAGCSRTGAMDACRTALRADEDRDYAAAREAYATCFERSDGQVDTHLGYQRILLLEDGDARAREAYAEIVSRRPSAQALLAQARLLPEDARVAAMESLAASRPEFIPTHYELSVAYSARVRGEQSLRDKVRERQHLIDFLNRADNNPAFAEAFVDYELASTWLDDARERLAKLKSFDVATADAPVSMNAMASNAGWILHFTVAEQHTDLEIRDSGGTWEPVQGTVSIPMGEEKTPFEIRYRDVHGDLAGPYTFELDPRRDLGKFGRDMLEKVPGSWVMLSGGGSSLLYFTTLITYRCAIDRVLYGFSGAPDREFDLPTCDPSDPYRIPNDATLYIEAPPDADSVVVQLVWYDGEKSKVQTVRRTGN